MEIYIKKHDDMAKVKWINSLPQKYREGIVDQILDHQIDIKPNKNYKIVVDLLKQQRYKPQRNKSANPTRKQATWKDVFDGLDYGPMLVRGVNARSTSPQPKPISSPKRELPQGPTQKEVTDPIAQQEMKFQGDVKAKKDTLREVMKDVRLKRSMTEKRNQSARVGSNVTSKRVYNYDLDPQKQSMMRLASNQQSRFKKPIAYPANQNKIEDFGIEMKPEFQYFKPVNVFEGISFEGMIPDFNRPDQLVKLHSKLQDQLSQNIQLMHQTASNTSGPMAFAELSAKNEVIYAQMVQVEELLGKQEYIRELERQQQELMVKQQILNIQMENSMPNQGNDYIDVVKIREKQAQIQAQNIQNDYLDATNQFMNGENMKGQMTQFTQNSMSPMLPYDQDQKNSLTGFNFKSGGNSSVAGDDEPDTALIRYSQAQVNDSSPHKKSTIGQDGLLIDEKVIQSGQDQLNQQFQIDQIKVSSTQMLSPPSEILKVQKVNEKSSEKAPSTMMAKNYQKKSEKDTGSAKTNKIHSKDARSKVYSSQDIRSKAESRFSKGNKNNSQSRQSSRRPSRNEDIKIKNVNHSKSQSAVAVTPNQLRTSKTQDLRVNLPANLPGPLPLSEMMQSSPHSQVSSVKAPNANIKGIGKNNLKGQSDFAVNSVDNLDQQDEGNKIKIDTIMQNPSKAASPRPSGQQSLGAQPLISSQSATQMNAQGVSIKVNNLSGADLTKIDERQEADQTLIKLSNNAKSQSFYITENTQSKAVLVEPNVDLVSYNQTQQQKPLSIIEQNKQFDVNKIYDRYRSMAQPLTTQNNNKRLIQFVDPSDIGDLPDGIQSHKNEKQYVTFNYFGQINGSFGIAKKKVALQDKYDTFIENAQKSRQQQLQAQEMARIQQLSENIRQDQSQEKGFNSKREKIETELGEPSIHRVPVSTQNNKINSDKAFFLTSNDQDLALNKELENKLNNLNITPNSNVNMQAAQHVKRNGNFRSKKLIRQHRVIKTNQTEEEFKEKYQNFQLQKIRDQRNANLKSYGTGQPIHTGGKVVMSAAGGLGLSQGQRESSNGRISANPSSKGMYKVRQSVHEMRIDNPRYVSQMSNIPRSNQFSGHNIQVDKMLSSTPVASQKPMKINAKRNSIKRKAEQSQAFVHSPNNKNSQSQLKDTVRFASGPQNSSNLNSINPISTVHINAASNQAIQTQSIPLSVTQKTQSSIVIPSVRNGDKIISDKNLRSSLAQQGNSPNSISGKKFKKKAPLAPMSSQKRQLNSQSQNQISIQKQFIKNQDMLYQQQQKYKQDQQILNNPILFQNQLDGERILATQQIYQGHDQIQFNSNVKIMDHKRQSSQMQRTQDAMTGQIQFTRNVSGGIMPDKSFQDKLIRKTELLRDLPESGMGSKSPSKNVTSRSRQKSNKKSFASQRRGSAKSSDNKSMIKVVDHSNALSRQITQQQKINKQEFVVQAKRPQSSHEKKTKMISLLETKIKREDMDEGTHEAEQFAQTMEQQKEQAPGIELSDDINQNTIQQVNTIELDLPSPKIQDSFKEYLSPNETNEAQINLQPLDPKPKTFKKAISLNFQDKNHQLQKSQDNPEIKALQSQQFQRSAEKPQEGRGTNSAQNASNEKTRNQITKSQLTANSFQNVEIQKNLSQKSFNKNPSKNDQQSLKESQKKLDDRVIIEGDQPNYNIMNEVKVEDNEFQVDDQKQPPLIQGTSFKNIQQLRSNTQQYSPQKSTINQMVPMPPSINQFQFMPQTVQGVPGSGMMSVNPNQYNYRVSSFKASINDNMYDDEDNKELYLKFIQFKQQKQAQISLKKAKGVNPLKPQKKTKRKPSNAPESKRFRSGAYEEKGKNNKLQNYPFKKIPQILKTAQYQSRQIIDSELSKSDRKSNMTNLVSVGSKHNKVVDKLETELSKQL